MVDNTFLGPTFQHPLELGADLRSIRPPSICPASATWWRGVAIGGLRALIRKIRSRRSMFGNILQPDECWMLDGRLPTVALRMNRQSKNAQRLAEALARPQTSERVIYPTLFDDPEQRRIFEKQCDFPGGIFSLEFKGGKPAAFEFLRRLRIAPGTRCRWAEWNRSRAIRNPPRIPGMSEEELDESGVTDGLVRISVGIEDWRDLLADFEQALAAVDSRPPMNAD